MIELSLPRTSRFLVVVLSLTILFYWQYYFKPIFMFERLEQAYYASFWQDTGKPTEICDLTIRYQIPRYVSSFVDRDILVSITNNLQDKAVDPVVVVTTQQQVIMVAKVERETKPGNLDSQSFLDFGSVPPGSSVVRHLSVRVPPGTKVGSVSFRFKLLMQGCNTTRGESPDITPDNVYTVAQIAPFNTIVQSIVQIMLLPPLANGFLPILALIIALAFEGFFPEPVPELPVRVKKADET